MRRAYGIASRACLNMRAGLAQMRMAQTFREVHHHFAGPVASLATAAFLCGRAYGQHEAGVETPDDPEVAHELVSDPKLEEPLREIRAVAEEALLQVADTLQYAVGKAYAVDLLSQWDGFHRFCQDNLGIDPVVLLRALGLEQGDPAAEVRNTYTSATADGTEITRWTAEWSRTWQRRFRDGR